jgi:hypothetical protein
MKAERRPHKKNGEIHVAIVMSLSHARASQHNRSMTDLKVLKRVFVSFIEEVKKCLQDKMCGLC